jgi:hypothetical protein
MKNVKVKRNMKAKTETQKKQKKYNALRKASGGKC